MPVRNPAKELGLLTILFCSEQENFTGLPELDVKDGLFKTRAKISEGLSSSILSCRVSGSFETAVSAVESCESSLPCTGSPQAGTKAVDCGWALLLAEHWGSSSTSVKRGSTSSNCCCSSLVTFSHGPGPSETHFVSDLGAAPSLFAYIHLFGLRMLASQFFPWFTLRASCSLSRLCRFFLLGIIPLGAKRRNLDHKELKERSHPGSGAVFHVVWAGGLIVEYNLLWLSSSSQVSMHSSKSPTPIEGSATKRGFPRGTAMAHVRRVWATCKLAPCFKASVLGNHAWKRETGGLSENMQKIYVLSKIQETMLY